jgi:hypothetical protein
MITNISVYLMSRKPHASAAGADKIGNPFSLYLKLVREQLNVGQDGLGRV